MFEKFVEESRPPGKEKIVEMPVLNSNVVPPFIPNITVQ
jgi:hypothetical protein